MRELMSETITDAVLDQTSTTSNARMREVMASAVRHLRAFARGADPSAIPKQTKLAAPAPAAS